MLTILAGIRSMRIPRRAESTEERRVSANDGLVTAASAECLDRHAHQVTDARLALCIGHCQGPCRAITGQRLFLPAKFCIEVATGQLEKRVCRIFFRQRTNHAQRLFILLIVTMEIQREVKASEIGSENTIGDGLLEKPHALWLGASRDTHEESQDP